MNTSIILGALFILTLAIIVWVVSTYNTFVKLKNLVQESWKQVDVELQRRYDLIPNLISTVKAAAAFEQSTLNKVVEARQKAMDVASGTPAARQEAEATLTGSLKNLFALAESYPGLNALQNYRDLQDEMSNTEDRIAAARRFYNQNAREMNTKRETVPASIIANAFHFAPVEYFELEEESARKPIRAEFNENGM